LDEIGLWEEVEQVGMLYELDMKDKDKGYGFK